VVVDAVVIVVFRTLGPTAGMFRAMASAWRGWSGSITAPLGILNQLAMSTAIVKFFVSLASVTGG